MVVFFIYVGPTLSCGDPRQVCHWAATPEKTPIGKRLLAHKKPIWGKLVSRVSQCPLAELGVLPSPVLAVYLHMSMMVMITGDDDHTCTCRCKKRFLRFLLFLSETRFYFLNVFLFSSG